MIPNKIFAYLNSNFKTLLLLYFLVQLFILLFTSLNYTSDSLYYYQLAQGCISNHTFYPTHQNFYNDYLVAPVYINLLIVLLSIINSKLVIGFLNIILNFTQVCLVYKITENIFGKNSGKTAVIIYCFYLSTLGMILMNYTEMLFMVFVLMSIYFFLKKSNLMYVCSGMFAGAAVGVRPLGWVLVAAYLINYFIDFKNLNKNFGNYSLLITGAAIFILGFGLFTYSNSGRFIYTSTNAPINILIGANDDATGAYNDRVFEKGNAGYIENPERFTYDQKQNLWMHEAEIWIFEHPLKWLSLFPMKLVHMFAWDDFSVSKLLVGNDWNLYRIVKNIFSGKFSEIMPGEQPFVKFSYFIILIVHHLYYYSLITMLLTVIFIYFKEIIENPILRILILFSVMGIFIHLLTFGDARYKYPYIITAMIFISPIVNQIVNKKKIKSLTGEYGKNYV